MTESDAGVVGDPGIVTPPLVSIRGAVKVFDLPAGKKGGGPQRVHALGPVDLEIRTGEFISVVGPSGCGKTTLLNSLAGLADLSEGVASFEGHVIHGQVPEGVGIVFQEDASLPWLSVFENAAFGLRRAGVDRTEVDTRVEAALRFMGLWSFREAYPSQLSGGMRQRMCIARSFVMRPRLFLLDEPFGALDQQTRLLMNDEILRLWRESRSTVVIITHAIDEAVLLATRIVVMSSRPGRVLAVIETGWSPDRDSRIVSQRRFGELTSQVWGLLRDESMKATGLTTGA